MTNDEIIAFMEAHGIEVPSPVVLVETVEHIFGSTASYERSSNAAGRLSPEIYHLVLVGALAKALTMLDGTFWRQSNDE